MLFSSLTLGVVMTAFPNNIARVEESGKINFPSFWKSYDSCENCDFSAKCCLAQLVLLEIVGLSTDPFSISID